MKTTHTPGPWYPERPYGEDGVYVACAVTSALVCKLNKVDGRFYQDAQESIDANARLIASAPALLEALETLLASSSKRAVDVLEAQEQAQAVIRRARGIE